MERLYRRRPGKCRAGRSGVYEAVTLRYVNFRWGLTGELQDMEVANGRVLSRHRFSGIPAEAEGVVDLDGRYLLPSFVDAHCHILPTGLDLAKLHLGSANSREEVLELVRQRHRDQPDGWLLAVHYDQNKLEDGLHL